MCSKSLRSQTAARGRFRRIHGGRPTTSLPAETITTSGVDAWLAPFRRFWSAHIDALECHLDDMRHTKEVQSTPTKRQTRRRI